MWAAPRRSPSPIRSTTRSGSWSNGRLIRPARSDSAGQDRVRPGPARTRVVPGPAVHPVVAVVAAEHVVARAALDHVVAVARLDEIDAVAAVELVVALAGGEQVVAPTSVDGQGPAEGGARHETRGSAAGDLDALDRADRVIRMPREAKQRVAHVPVPIAGRRDRILPLAPQDLPGARAGIEPVLPVAAPQGVGPSTAVDRVAQPRADHRVAPLLPIDGDLLEPAE